MMALADYEANDAGFVADLIESQRAVWYAARLLNEMGYNVTIRPQNIRPSVEQMSEFADDGDLEIIQRIEVKRRRQPYFTGKGDFPFPTMIVDVAHTWDRASPKPFAYLIFNSDLTVCCAVRGETSDMWNRVERWDRGKSRTRTFYECPLDLCDFFQTGGDKNDRTG
jgi:hypothetical protein